MDDPAVWHDVWSKALLFVPRLAIGLLLVLAFWVGGIFAQRVVNQLTHVRRLDVGLTLFLGRAAKIAFVVVGLVTALGTLGVDVTALVAGLGLTGFALGLAMKDIISNALSGILVLLYKPFKEGDHISVTSLEGTVSEVNLRYTVLDAQDKWIFVPNANLLANPVTVNKRTGDSASPL
jgi:small-conductance mechanosensitive channel